MVTTMDNRVLPGQGLFADLAQGRVHSAENQGLGCEAFAPSLPQQIRGSLFGVPVRNVRMFWLSARSLYFEACARTLENGG